jgi:uncharacterized protein YjbI with pentapeptide repeats
MSSTLNFSKQTLTEESFKGQDLSGTNVCTTLPKYLFVVIASVLLGFLQACFSFIAVGIIKKAVGEHEPIFVTLGIGVIFFVIAVTFVNQRLMDFFTNFLDLTVIGTIAVIVPIAVALKIGLAVEIIGAAIVIAIVLAVSAIAIAGLIVIADIGIGRAAAIISVAILMMIAIAAGWLDLKNLPQEFQSLIVILAVAYCLSLYVAYRAYSKDTRFLLWWQWGLTLGAWGNANFSSADLTDADFSEANLKRVNFSYAKLRRTNFQNTQNLQWADVRNTILVNPEIRELLVTGKGRKQSFAGLSLKGAYLVNADLRYCNLSDVNLEDADLRNVKLQDADLSRANVLNVDFSGANLTGVCIENWMIDHTTRFNNTQCDFVYLHEGKRDRYPELRNFDQGEFAKLCDDSVKALQLVDELKKNIADMNAGNKDLIKIINKLIKRSGIIIGAINAEGANVIISELIKSLNNTIDQPPKAHADLKSLLTQLQRSIEKSQLNDEDKKLALDYVQSITEIYQQHLSNSKLL